MRRLGKALGLWLFGFDLDEEFLRGVACGRQWRDEELAQQNGGTWKITYPPDGTSAPTLPYPFQVWYTGDDPNRPQNTCSTAVLKDGAGA